MSTMSIGRRLSSLENRRKFIGEWPELIILHEGVEMTPHQRSECDRAEKYNLPTLTITIGSARHGK